MSARPIESLSMGKGQRQRREEERQSLAAVIKEAEAAERRAGAAAAADETRREIDTAEQRLRREEITRRVEDAIKGVASHVFAGDFGDLITLAHAEGRFVTEVEIERRVSELADVVLRRKKDCLLRTLDPLVVPTEIGGRHRLSVLRARVDKAPTDEAFERVAAEAEVFSTQCGRAERMLRRGPCTHFAGDMDTAQYRKFIVWAMDHDVDQMTAAERKAWRARVKHHLNGVLCECKGLCDPLYDDLPDDYCWHYSSRPFDENAKKVKDTFFWLYPELSGPVLGGGRPAGFGRAGAAGAGRA